MNKFISSLRNTTTATLTSFGKSVFYLYITLSVLGFTGVLFGTITLILKVSHISAMLTPWWEIISLIAISWITMNMFTKESLALVETKSPEQQKVIKLKIANESFIDPHYHVPSNSNVINLADIRNKQDGHL